MSTRHNIDTAAVTLCAFAIFAAVLVLAGAVVESCRAEAAPPVIVWEDPTSDYPMSTAPEPSSPDEVRAGTCPPSPPTDFERSVIEAADNDCVNRHGVRQAEPGRLDIVEALAWLREEWSAGFPLEAIGLTLASWCREGSYLREGWCVRGSCDKGLADGPLQMHRIFARLCWGGEDRRTDLRATVRCYLDRIALRVSEVERRCGQRDWLTAQAWVASAPRYYPRCDALSQHGEIHQRWRSRP